jgi:glycosyltransferase involved in cell wall biosynthesis
LVTTRAPLVSVIIPAFNAGRWIRDSTGSVITQTYSNLELIVVDDGSTDQTPVFLAELADPRVHVIRQAQLGAAAARNMGLSVARGELIQFLDADDLLSANKIEMQVRALGSAERGCIASCEWVHVTRAEIRKPLETTAWCTEDPIEWLVQSLRGGGMMQPAGWLTPRELIDRAGGWNEELTLHDDGDFFARVLGESTRNIFVEDALVLYRDNAAGLSRQRSRRAAESALAVCRSRHAVIIARRSDIEARSAIATQYAQFAYEFLKDHPDLADQALAEIRTLAVAPDPVIGGPLFRIVAQVSGFPTALGIRRMLSGLRG